MLKETTFGENVKQGITEIKINGVIQSDPQIIAEEFNNFFTSIGQTISDNVTPSNTNPESYLADYDQQKPKFSLGNTGEIHIIDIIKSFQSKASPDLDGISLKIIKYVAFEISRPLAHIFNLSIDDLYVH